MDLAITITQITTTLPDVLDLPMSKDERARLRDYLEYLLDTLEEIQQRQAEKHQPGELSQT